MSNILKKFNKTGVITTGTDNLQLDSPSFEIINVGIDTVNSVLHVEVLHTVMQGSLERKHSRTFDVAFGGLPTGVKTSGKSFLDAIEQEILALPQYTGATAG